MKFDVTIPFTAHLGFDLIHLAAGESTIEFSPKPEHLNSFGVTHGGAIMTLLDVSMAQAARSVAPEMGLATIEMKTSFMKPVPGDGSTLTGRGHLIQRTKSMAFVEAKLHDSQGNLCAQASGTFKYVKRSESNPAQAGLPASQLLTD
jgi:uncharacterized protein (TIGR00369 family)